MFTCRQYIFGIEFVLFFFFLGGSDSFPLKKGRAYLIWRNVLLCLCMRYLNFVFFAFVRQLFVSVILYCLCLLYYVVTAIIDGIAIIGKLDFQ